MSELKITSFDPNANFEELKNGVQEGAGSRGTMAECVDLCAGYIFSACNRINSTSMKLQWKDDNNNAVAECYVFTGSELTTVRRLIRCYSVLNSFYINLKQNIMNFLKPGEKIYSCNVKVNQDQVTSHIEQGVKDADKGNLYTSEEVLGELEKEALNIAIKAGLDDIEADKTVSGEDAFNRLKKETN